jgi:hypothetical protein
VTFKKWAERALAAVPAWSMLVGVLLWSVLAFLIWLVLIGGDALRSVP